MENCVASFEFSSFLVFQIQSVLNWYNFSLLVNTEIKKVLVLNFGMKRLN